MHWIKPISGIVLAMSLVGCASNDTALPGPDRTMLDIYRQALEEPSSETSEQSLFDSAALCEALAKPSEKRQQACREIVTAHLDRVYGALDTDTVGQSIDYLAYSRTVETELDNLFPRFKNPDIVIYVYPHLATRARAPIPGYSTAISLYEQVEYRMPGESDAGRRPRLLLELDSNLEQ